MLGIFGGLGPEGPHRLYQCETICKFRKISVVPNQGGGVLLFSWQGGLERAKSVGEAGSWSGAQKEYEKVDQNGVFGGCGLTIGAGHGKQKSKSGA